MAGSTFPAYIRAEYISDSGAFERFVSDVGGAGKRAQSAMEKALSGVKDTVAQALTVPRNAFGSLDVGVGQLRALENQLKASAAASLEVKRALIAEGNARSDTSQSNLEAVKAANQYTLSLNENIASIQRDIAFNERLQAALNKTALATERAALSQRDLDAASSGGRQSKVRTFSSQEVFNPAVRSASDDGATTGALSQREAMDELRRAEVGVAEQEKILQGIHRGTALEQNKIANSARASATAFEQYDRQLEDLLQTLNPLYFAQKSANEKIEFAAQAMRRGDISAEQYQQSVASLNATLGRQNGAFGANRQAMVQTGQQLQDLGISLYSGQRASTVFAQQLPQLAFALTYLEGSTNKTQNAIGRFAAMLSGPLGSIALVAASVGLGVLVEKLFFAEKATKEAEKVTYDFTRAFDVQKLSIDNVTDAMKQLNQQVSGLIEGNKLLADQGLIIANSSLAGIEAKKASIDAEIQTLKQQLRDGFGSFDIYSDLIKGQRYEELITQSAELGKALGESRATAESAAIAASQLRVNEASEPLTKARNDYDRKLQKLEALRREGIKNENDPLRIGATVKPSLGKAEYEKRLDAAKQEYELAKETNKERNKSPKSDPAYASSQKVSFAPPNEIVDNFKRVSSGFGPRKPPKQGASAFHQALDIVAANGSNVRAPYIGTVELVGIDKGLGKYVVIDHGAGTKTRYGHLSNNSIVKPGDRVNRGDVIGKVGSTGTSTGNHLHLEAILNGKFNAQGKLLSGRKIDPRKALPVNDAEASSDAQRNIDDQNRALEEARKQAEAFANELQKIDQITQNITGEFDDQPRLIDRINRAGLKLRQTTADIDRQIADSNTTTEQRVELENRKLEISRAQLLVGSFIQKQMQSDKDDFDKSIKLQNLVIAGREDEANILERINAAKAKYGVDKELAVHSQLLSQSQAILESETSTVSQKAQAKSVVKQTLPLYQKALDFEAEITGEQTRQYTITTNIAQFGERIQRQRQAYAGYIDSTYSSLENLLSGGKVSDFFSEFKIGFEKLQGTLLTDKLFGDSFDQLRKFNNRRSPENTAIQNFVDTTSLAENALIDLTNAASAAASAVANDNEPITVIAKRDNLSDTYKFLDKIAQSIVDPFTKELDQIFNTKFFTGISGVISGSLKGFARAGGVGAVLGGAQGVFEKLARRNAETGIAANLKFGDLSNKFGKALQGAETGGQISRGIGSFGIKTSSAGGQLGGAAGQAIGTIFGGPAGGALGSIIGGTIGSVVGGLFKKSKKADLTITNSGVSANGNKALTQGLSDGGNEIQDKIKAIAEQLGGTVGAFSLAIKQKNNKFTFAGRTFGDFESAAEAALLSAIQNGAVQGVTAGAQRLLRAGTELDRQLQKALSFQGVFDRLKEYDDPVGFALSKLDREFANLKNIFAEAGASAEEYGQLQRLYEIDRAKAIEDANSRVTASLKSLYSELTVGNDARSLRDRQAFAKTAYDPLAARVAVGDKTAYDAYSDAARSLLDIERQIYGSQTQYFDRLNEVTNLTKARIEEESNVTSINRLGLTFTNAISEQTSALLASLNAMNANIGNLNVYNRKTVNGGDQIDFGGTYY